MCGSQIQDMENDFKTTTKTAQALVKDSSPDVVNEMLQTLNVQKEVIVRLRKEIPERIKYLKAMLPNVESLETGISDLNIWLDKGEDVLSANKMEGSQSGAEEKLEKHKVCFTIAGIYCSCHIWEADQQCFQWKFSFVIKQKIGCGYLLDSLYKSLENIVLYIIQQTEKWKGT